MDTRHGWKQEEQELVNLTMVVDLATENVNCEL